MRRPDNVFFFVLVDFFVQLLFVGLVVYAIGSGKAPAEQSDVRRPSQAQIDTFVVRTGISDLSELTDALSRLVPAGHPTAARVVPLLDSLAAMAREAGGLPGLLAKVRAVRDTVRRVGVIPCLRGAQGTGAPLVVGAGVLSDSAFRLNEIDPPLRAAFDSMHVSAIPGVEVPLAQLRIVYGPLRQKRACKYTIRVTYTTDRLSAQDILLGYFHVERVRRRQ